MSPQMRIAMFFSSDPSSSGGVQEHVLNLSNTLIKLGHQVDVYGPPNSIYLFKNYFPVGRVLPVLLPNGNWANLHFVTNFKEIQSKLDKLSYDVYHIHEPYIPILSWLLMKHGQTPKIATFHTGWNDLSVLNILNKIIPLFKKYYSQYISGSIYISSLVEKRWNGLSNSNIIQKVILYGLDHKKYHPIENTKNSVINLLFLARIVRRKGLHLLLGALSVCKKRGLRFKLTIIGEGKERNRMEMLVKKLDLCKNVKFLGEITGDKKISYYQKSEIFCAPYSDEGLGLTVFEAIACGCTVVGFWNQAYEDILDRYPGKHLLVTQKDVNQLAFALEKAATSPSLRNSLRTWSVVKGGLKSWEDVGSQTEKMYIQVVKKTKDYTMYL